MQKTSFFPPFIRTLSVLFIGTLLALVLARGAMLGILWPEVAGNPASDILNACTSVRSFDIRMVVLGLIPIALILGIPPLERLLVRSRGFRGLIRLAVRRGFRRGHARVHHRFRLVLLHAHPRGREPVRTARRPGHRRDDGLGKLPRRLESRSGSSWLRRCTPCSSANAGQARSHAALGWKGRTGWSVATFVILFLPRLRTDQLQPLPAALEQRLFSAWTKTSPSSP